MSNTKIILFNGPPRSGKDTCAMSAWRHVYYTVKKPCMMYKLAEPLKEAVHSMYGLKVDVDHFEETKDIPNDVFGGLTPRQAYISLSEDYIKPKFGKSFFGKAAVNYLKTRSDSLMVNAVVISDCGFTEELEPILEAFGKENISIIQVERPGKDFSNDSRSYVAIPGVPIYRIYNDGTLSDLETSVKLTLDIILKGRP